MANLKSTLTFLMIGLLTTYTTAQDNCAIIKKNLENTLLPNITDTLTNHIYTVDMDCAINLARVASKKAKEKNDKRVLSNIYSSIGQAYFEDISLKYLDSLYLLNSSSTDLYYSESPYLMGVYYYYYENPEKSLQLFTESYDRAKETKDFYIKSKSKSLISSVKLEQNNDKSSLIAAHQALYELANWKDGPEHQKEELKLMGYEAIIRYHLFEKNIDSSFYYINKMEPLLKSEMGSNFEGSHKTFLAQTYFMNEQYEKAFPIMHSQYEKEEEFFDKLDLLYYLGEIEGFRGNFNKKVSYFNEYKTIMDEQSTLSPAQHSRDVYFFLLNQAIKSNNSEKQLAYYEKLFTLDSLISVNKENSRLYSVPEFSINELKKDRDALKASLEKYPYFHAILSLIIVSTLVVGINYYSKYTRARKKLKQLIDQEREKKEEIEEIPAYKQSEKLKPSIEIAIHKIDKWEKEKGYLNPNVTLNTLSSEFKTNRSYISKAVNIRKNKEFPKYINDLRINHFISVTKNGYDLNNQSINTVIQKFGFKSVDTFSRTLKAKFNDNTITPAMYFNEINKRNS